MNTKTVFFLLLILSATGFISPPIALCAGIIFGLSLEHPYASDSRALAKFLLQASVVALGFGMNLHEVLKAGRSGFIYTALGIGFALAAGFLIGKLVSVRSNGDLRRQCHRRDRPDSPGWRRGNGRRSRHSLHSKFHRPVHLSFHRRSPLPFAIAIWLMVGARDS
jgi:hypothetical protein